MSRRKRSVSRSIVSRHSFLASLHFMSGCRNRGSRLSLEPGESPGPRSEAASRLVLRRLSSSITTGSMSSTSCPSPPFPGRYFIPTMIRLASHDCCFHPQKGQFFTGPSGRKYHSGVPLQGMSGGRSSRSHASRQIRPLHGNIWHLEFRIMQGLFILSNPYRLPLVSGKVSCMRPLTCHSGGLSLSRHSVLRHGIYPVSFSPP